MSVVTGLVHIIFGAGGLVRNAAAGRLMEDFLIAAVASVLMIRLYLRLTGYPNLGGDQLHIAHMLWGGLFMLVAIFLLLGFLNNSVREIAAIIGGIGFGTFIDELGKFITQDNDYFYQPTVALIYMVVVLLYLTARAIDQARAPTPRENLLNALELIKDSAIGDLAGPDREPVLHLLEQTDPEDPLARALRAALSDVRFVPASRRPPLARLREIAGLIYQRLLREPWFTGAVVAVLLIHSITTFAQSVAAVQWTIGLGLWLGGGGVSLSLLIRFRKRWDPRTGSLGTVLLLMIAALTAWGYTVNLKEEPLTFVEVGKLLFPTVSSVLVAIGVFSMPRSRLNAYRMFQRAVLISILLTQVYAFYNQEFVALGALMLNLLILGVVRYLISVEEEQFHYPR
ncbi:MAG: hypothetical protein O2783_07240 [Chloroflexi bacterium]|nr:hypothetical protein [Chloroflexota bacterium]